MDRWKIIYVGESVVSNLAGVFQNGTIAFVDEVLAKSLGSGWEVFTPAGTPWLNQDHAARFVDLLASDSVLEGDPKVFDPNYGTVGHNKPKHKHNKHD